MSTTIYNLRPKSEPQEYTCNLLPVNINFTGELTTATEFWQLQLETTDGKTKSENKNEDNGQEFKISKNYLRGRKLIGRHHIYKSTDASSKDIESQKFSFLLFKKGEINFQDDSRTYELIGNCNELVNFGHEKLPDSNDPAEKLNEWLSLSECIHNDDNDE